MSNKIAKTLAAVALGALAAYLAPKAVKRDKAVPIPVGKSLSFLPERTGANLNALRVYYYRPAAWTEVNDVFIAFHGFNRNAEDFVDALKTLADDRNVIVVCPEFSKEKYPGARWYQEGNMSDADDVTGNPQPRRAWTFGAIDRIIEEVKDRAQTKGRVIVYGHSAGAQLLHRWVLFGGPEVKVDHIAIANAGWWTFPNKNIRFPYGIANVDISEEELLAAFDKPVTLFMGGADTSREKPFRDTPEADDQGMNRMERCTNFFHVCKKIAEGREVPFAWNLITVEGVAHQAVRMADGVLSYYDGLAQEGDLSYEPSEIEEEITEASREEEAASDAKEVPEEGSTFRDDKEDAVPVEAEIIPPEK